MILVVGTTRSGTSMRMRQLHAGGADVKTDDRIKASRHNPHGFYEIANSHQVARDHQHDQLAAVKILAAELDQLLPTLDVHPQILVCRRDPRTSAASRVEMMGRGPDLIEPWAEVFAESMRRCEAALFGLPHLNLPYDDALRDAWADAHRIADFLGGGMDVAAMAAVPDRALRHYGVPA